MSAEQTSNWRDGPGPELGSWSSETAEWPTELLFKLTLTDAARPQHTFTTPWGMRRETSAAGGHFEGPGISGTVLGGLANDWGFGTEDGIAGIDANIVLKTSDDIPMFMTFYGRMCTDGRVRISPLFETPDGPLAWFTQVQTVGIGQAEGDDLVINIYALK